MPPAPTNSLFHKQASLSGLLPGKSSETREPARTLLIPKEMDVPCVPP